MICVSIGSGSPAEAKKILQKSGFIELRADLLDWDIKDYIDIVGSGYRTVFTCRPGKLNDKDRLELFEQVAHAGATYIDAENDAGEMYLDGIRKIASESRSELIISYHNYEMTPASDVLEAIMLSCYDLGADIAKIACRVYSQADAARLLALYGISGRKVVIGMGKTGKITRLAAPFLGAEFTFASSGEGVSTAEGQIQYKEMNDIIKSIQQIP